MRPTGRDRNDSLKTSRNSLTRPAPEDERMAKRQAECNPVPLWFLIKNRSNSQPVSDRAGSLVKVSRSAPALAPSPVFLQRKTDKQLQPARRLRSGPTRIAIVV